MSVLTLTKEVNS